MEENKTRSFLTALIGSRKCASSRYDVYHARLTKLHGTWENPNAPRSPAIQTLNGQGRTNLL